MPYRPILNDTDGCDLFYIYAFSRRFYPKQLTLHSGYTFFVSMCVPWESNPQPLRNALPEPQEHLFYLL